ncbi:maleylpyruvate isomerase family mycothiol-dependent enzyme [Streptomyces abyssomicinicus]|uniref:maleylpyruvate isomerase family mycothiol-dependent enzyme n=1 Tax=Streptomyces abyssomicinicus TaxID=574929 RepID=UPI0012504C5B|nr:maleylpyruvate isomerase family mycothiol-dependent enzyme [Streptomyces abyssomicinicus]
MTTSADARHPVRDPELPGRLLGREREEFVPLLRSRPDADFLAPVPACPGWTVRDALAHCGAVLTRLVEGRWEKGVGSPGHNARDIAARADWPVARIVDELDRGMREAGPVIAGLEDGGVRDGVALGEWVHAGDVREAWGLPGAYAGPGQADALRLLAWVTGSFRLVAVHADLDGYDEPLRLGDGAAVPARYIGDAATLLRLYSGRPVAGASYELAGVTGAELNLFG